MITRMLAPAFVLVLSVLCSARLTAQGEPLPPEMVVVTTASGPFSASMVVRNPGGQISVVVGIDGNNDTKTVTLTWLYQTQSTEPGVLETVISTSYQPTAATAVAGTGDAIYIAGWDARSGSALVEEWVFQGANVLGPRITAGWTPDDIPGTQASFSEPTIEKTLVFTCDSMGPILDLVRNPVTDELILLERTGGVQRTVWGYDLASTNARCGSLGVLSAGTPAVTLSSTTLPSLEGLNSIWEGRRSSGGFVLFLDPAFTYLPSQASLDSIPIVYFGDLDENGVMETLHESTVQGFFQAFDADGFDLDYQ